MPWRLVLAIIVFVILLIFVSFNLGLENKCDINFGFGTIAGVPVFITIFISFIFGFLSTLPFVIRAGLRRKKPPVNNLKPEPKTQAPVEKDGKPDDGGADDIK